jgi:hypothetical protein
MNMADAADEAHCLTSRRVVDAGETPDNTGGGAGTPTAAAVSVAQREFRSAPGRFPPSAQVYAADFQQREGSTTSSVFQHTIRIALQRIFEIMTVHRQVAARMREAAIAEPYLSALQQTVDIMTSRELLVLDQVAARMPDGLVSSTSSLAVGRAFSNSARVFESAALDESDSSGPPSLVDVGEDHFDDSSPS